MARRYDENQASMDFRPRKSQGQSFTKGKIYLNLKLKLTFLQNEDHVRTIQETSLPATECEWVSYVKAGDFDTEYDLAIVTTSDNNVLSTVVGSGLRYLLSIVIGLLIVPTNDDECQR